MISIQQLIKVECDGLLISFSFKLFILAIGTWAVFYRYVVIIREEITKKWKFS